MLKVRGGNGYFTVLCRRHPFFILLDFEERNSQVKNFNDGELKSFSMIIIDALDRKSRVETNGEEKN